MNKTLIYAIGNEGRQDDGLAHRFVEVLSETRNFDFHQSYQLNVEDAELISRYHKILFVDAAKNQKEAFKYFQPSPLPESGFTTHGLTIEGVMALTKEIYGKLPSVSVLAIRGEKFDLKIGLTSKAQKNLQEALHWFHEKFINN